MEDGGELTDRIVPLLKNGGHIILFVLNRREVRNVGEFGASVTFQSARFVRASAIPTEIHFVPSNVARRWGRNGMSRLRRLMNKGLWLTAPLTAVGAGFFLLCSFIGNLDAWRATRRVAGRGHMSSFVMRLVVDAPKIATAQHSRVPTARRGATSCSQVASVSSLLRPMRPVNPNTIDASNCEILSDLRHLV